MPTTAMNSPSILTTPIRERNQTYRSDLSSHSSSPTTLRVAHSSGSSSNAPGPSTTPLTVQSLLATCSTSSDPKLAALEHAVSDRNTLCSQNSQLWKLIEKQRAGYAQLLKELERVRGERDLFRAKLLETGQNTDALLKAHREKEKRAGKDASLRSAASHTHLRSSESNGSSGSGSGSAALDPRTNIARTKSDDIESQRNTPSAQSSEPLWASTGSGPYGRQRQGSQNSLNIPFSTSHLSTSYMLPSEASTSNHIPAFVSEPNPEPMASRSQPNTAVEGSADARNQFPPPPARSGSLPLSVVTSGNTHSTPPVSRTVVMDDPGTSARAIHAFPSAENPASVISPLSPRHGDPSLQPQADHSLLPQPLVSQPLVIVQSASSSDPPSQNSHWDSSNELAPPSQPQELARESRVSLPEEAKRYYAIMGESPSPSPRSNRVFPDARSGSLSPDKASAKARSESPLKQAVDSYSIRDDPADSRATPGGDSGEFLDLEDADSLSDSVNDSGRISVADSIDPEDSSVEQAFQESRKDKKHAVVEDFPLPPSSPPMHHGDTFTHVQMQHVPPHIHAPSLKQSISDSVSDESSMQPQSNGAPDSSTSLDSRGLPPPRESSQRPTLSTISTQDLTPQATFRALPLLASDLPQTTIVVSNSTIRPNDRGKEVLSFVINVNPGRGKESWQVEKLYSDVLTLDSRIRATIGKSMGKRLVNLPEGRLWKDHAPAKVDQRKVALELYLRSLIALPVKNKDEVIAFFTSDILREAKKPVLQAGYKEGYLTKRGKNFGGWKTRYFVLQGPSLEYYESRGGTHLGSITITGAQIGRQQRAADKKDSDEDNEYRHAFLIIEAKKGPGGSNPRHVLCAESDQDRDSWVEELVRYVTGTYNEEEFSVAQNGGNIIAGRTSTSSNAPSDVLSTPTRRLRKEDITKGPAVPSLQFPLDPSNAKLFQSTPIPSDEFSITSPVKPNPPSYVDPFMDAPLSSSLPVSSPLVAEDPDIIAPIEQRANSEMGHYPDLVDQRSAASKSKQGFSSAEQQRRKDRRRSMNPLKTSPIPERSPSPEKDPALHTPRVDAHGKVKISGPMNGTPIPAGYKFGGKDAPPEPPMPLNDRREKAKSRSFWGFGRPQQDKPNVPVHVPRAVFGVSLEESLDVAEIASLPAIVFRCIQYLEVKKAELEEGIYRLSGSSAVIKALKDRFNNEGDVDLIGSDEYWDPHAIAGLLKTFLRELPASILTRDLHLRFLSVIDFVDPQERIAELSQLIASLPITNYSLLRALTAHLILIVQNANVNKMTMRNVGIVFSPTLGIPAGVFSLMLGEFKRVFNVDGALEQDDEVVQEMGGADLSRRNSKHYSDAAADQLLGLSGRTLTATEEGQSDEGDELSVNDESGTEGTEITEHESMLEGSEASSLLPQFSQQADQADLLHPSDYNEPTSPLSASRSRASTLAATRGLNVTTSSDKASRRHSRMVGLPHSPRPPHSGSSSPHTPQRAGSSPAPVAASPLHTPK